ncbi:MAG: 4-(cytidine 5'-diphospho)-2-C-methyl-D-erythritol kinase [Clostridiales bacterium]|jgi:4-diphosphocytidyl-2-C-methyl-D-erythritol kinase|nr:4-(cytidine 5'-diphospho)-2-C-methyl-D-erythritol kinase [Clostridiales bacterium]
MAIYENYACRHNLGDKMELTLHARAKINLALDVVRKREDGYHDLRMIMQTVELHDDIIMRQCNPIDNNGAIKLLTNLPYLPTDERNLVYQAAEYMFSKYRLTGGLFIGLKKRIPVAAGLAGGSADCAAAILGINRLYGLKLTLPAMTELGKRFGADVPFCLLGGTALAEGVGDKLTPLSPHPKTVVAIVKPPVSISTASTFKAFSNNVSRRPDFDSILHALEQSDVRGIAANFLNVLEEKNIFLYPDILRIKNIFLEMGAMGALMSGSGSAVFAYFETKESAQEAVLQIQAELPRVKEVNVTHTD